MEKIIIVGKKNVGKSSLFNLITKKKDSTTIDYEGYTRDCLSCITKIKSKTFELTDTAGIGYEKTILDYKTIKNTWEKIKLSDTVILMIDASDTYIDDNINILNIIKRLKKKIIYVINKIELKHISELDIIKKLLKIKETINISIKKQLGIDTLFEEIIKNAHTTESIKINHELKIAVVGKPNAGKSSLINKLTKSNNLIVDNTPGTTRDIIKSNFILKGNTYKIIDTPGIKKKNNVKSEIDKILIKNALNAIKISDIIIIIIDNEITNQDIEIINYIKKQEKNLIISINKSDTKNKNNLIKTNNKIKNYIRKQIEYVFVSAKYNFGIENLINLILKIKNFQKIKFDKEKLINILKNLKKYKIKNIKIEKYMPLTLKIEKNNSIFISHTQKKYITSFIIYALKIKSISTKIIFE
ncbi:MAG TPA: GTPase [Candidatus Azoamicus sp.]